VRGNRYGLEFAHETRIDCDPETMDALMCEVIRLSFPEHEPQLREAPEPVEDVAAAEDHQRTAVRHPLIWSGILHHDHESQPARLRNVSENGALVECTSAFPVGAHVQLDLGAAGRVSATVCWSLGAQTGLAFDRPFDLRDLAQAKPEVTSAEWVVPEYLTPHRGTSVPAVEPWRHASIEELSRSLGG